MKKSVLTGCRLHLSPSKPRGPISQQQLQAQLRDGAGVGGAGDRRWGLLQDPLTKKGEEAKGQRKTFVFPAGKQILAPFSARSCLPALDSASPPGVPLKLSPSGFLRIPPPSIKLPQASPKDPRSASASSLSLDFLSFSLSLLPQTRPPALSLLPLPPPSPDLFPLSLLPQSRPRSAQPLPSASLSEPPLSASSLSQPPLSAFPQRLSLSQPPRSHLLSLPLPDPARPRPRRAHGAHRRSSNRLSSWCPESAPSCSPPVPPVSPSVQPPARGSAQRPTQGGGGGPPARSARPLPGSPIAAQPGHGSSQSACAGTARNSAGGKGSPERQPRAPWACTKVCDRGVGELPGDRTISPGGRKQSRTLHRPILVLESVLGDQKPTL